MTIGPGEYAHILSAAHGLKWKRPKGEPRGMEEIVLHKHRDGSYTHLLRIEAGVEIHEPVSHVFYEEAYYVSGEMLDTKTNKLITGGSYVFHRPGEKHGPFRCLKTCLILEFRYYN